MSPFLSWYFTCTTPQGYQGTEMAVASFCATVAYPAISKTNVVRLILHHLHPQDLRGSSSFSLNSRWGPNTWTWTRIFPTVHHSINFFQSTLLVSQQVIGLKFHLGYQREVDKNNVTWVEYRKEASRKAFANDVQHLQQRWYVQSLTKL